MSVHAATRRTTEASLVGHIEFGVDVLCRGMLAGPAPPGSGSMGGPGEGFRGVDRTHSGSRSRRGNVAGTSEEAGRRRSGASTFGRQGEGGSSSEEN